MNKGARIGRLGPEVCSDLSEGFRKDAEREGESWLDSFTLAVVCRAVSWGERGSLGTFEGALCPLLNPIRNLWLHCHHNHQEYAAIFRLSEKQGSDTGPLFVPLAL